jgi:YHS domain-containing protein
MNISRRTLLTLAAGGWVAVPAWAKTAPVYTRLFSSTALNGFDAVAYFTEGKPVKGGAEFNHTHNGVKWLFASAAHRDQFAAQPTAYAPQYGGYCAWAMAQRDTAPGDPMFWKIVDGKLYVNFDGDVQAKWQKDIPGFIAKADKNWPELLAE